MNGTEGRGRIRFRIKGWLSREDFEELLQFSRYLGRTDDESLFEVDLDKANRNNVGLEDIINKLEELGVSTQIIEALRNIQQNEAEEAVLLLEGNVFLLKPRTYLGERISGLKDLMKYDRNRKCFVIQPGLVWRVVEKLRELGVNVVDKSGVPFTVPLPSRISFRGELRDYQKEALEAFRSHGYRGIIALPTGAGKTIIAIAALAELGVRTLIVAFTKEQLHQWVEKIKELTDAPGGSIATFYSEEKKLAPITVTTYQTAYRHIHEFAFRFTFLVVDEVHHLPADKFRAIALGMYAPYRMGLSATVVREDGRHVELFPLMGGVIYSKSPDELAEKGYLARYISKIIKVELKPDEKKRFEELRKLYRSLAGGSTFQELVNRASRGDKEAALALKVHSEMLQLIHRSKAKAEAVKKIVEEELKNNSKILVFTQYVEQAKELGEILGAPVLTGETDTRERKRILEEFRSAPRGVLVLTTVGDEGLDIPDVNVGIIVAGTGSRRQYIQRLGRLLRPGTNKVARLYEIVTRGTGEESLARRRRTASLDLE